MADKTIEELSKATELKDEDSFPIEQDGEPRRGTVGQLKDVAKSVAQPFADEAAKSAEAAKTDADRAAEKAKDAADVALHPPKIQGGNWWTWDTAKNDYVDSGVDAGVSLTIAETVTGKPGDPAKVENVGTPTDPKLKFTIPLGKQGPVSSVNGGTGDVVIGGRNLLLRSGEIVSNNAYNIARYYFGGDRPVAGEYYILSVKLSEVGEGKTRLDVFNSGGTLAVGNIALNGPGIYQAKVFWKTASSSGVEVANTNIDLFMFPREVETKSTIDWIKLERGNVATDWTPAPEDKADVPTQFDVFLPASGWINGSQTVADARFIDGDNIDWDVDVKGACIPWDGITITAGQMVARADIVPVEDMTWVVTRREVRIDG